MRSLIFESMDMRENIQNYGNNKIRELVSILLGSPFYLTVPIKDRYKLIKRLSEEYQMFSEQPEEGADLS
jgi:hypothetical protein